MNELALPQFGELQAQARLDHTSLELPEKLTSKEWTEVGLALGRIEQSTLWWIGDWWAFGEHKWKDRKTIVECDDWTGPTWDVCRHAGQVCRAFKESGRRRPLLSFSHHVEVVLLPEDEADELLDWCEEPLKNGAERPRTKRELRDKIKRIKAKRIKAEGWNVSQRERKAKVLKGETVLANMSTAEDGLPIDNALITWAESEGLTVRIDRQTEWGNPYELGADGTREEVLQWFEEYFEHKRSLHKKLDLLVGKVLLCWCHPEQCHGDCLINARQE